jgi:hypothetical protein
VFRVQLQVAHVSPLFDLVMIRIMSIDHGFVKATPGPGSPCSRRVIDL